MSKVIYAGKAYECGTDSVLDCLTSNGIKIPSSCRSGACQSCLMHAISGQVPAKANAGLKPTQAAQNYFLACSCYPDEDIEVALPNAKTDTCKATISSLSRLSADVLGVRLTPEKSYNYRAGQFIRLYKECGASRCYSLASVPEIDDSLFLNVKKVPGGLVSGWLFDEAKVGDVVEISDATGECCYSPDKPAQDMLLIATGTGLAPLYGIVRDALKQAHHGRLYLYHGYDENGFYLTEELKQLMQSHPNFSYVPCVAKQGAPGVLDVALQAHPKLSGWRVYLCGNPNMVNAARQQTFFAGASIQEIYADPFSPSS